MSILYWVVLFVVAQRAFELAIAHYNTIRLTAEGGVEYGARHYPLLVALHAAWLVCLTLFGSTDQPVYASFLAIFFGLQIARIWVIVSLGRQWTTRIVVAPGRPLVRHGPYRWIRHPNYLIVALEILFLPLAFGAWKTALVFSLLNAAILYHRIQIEEAALLKGKRADHAG